MTMISVWPFELKLDHKYIGETGTLAICKTLLHHPAVYSLSLVNGKIPVQSAVDYKENCYKSIDIWFRLDLFSKFIED